MRALYSLSSQARAAHLRQLVGLRVELAHDPGRTGEQAKSYFGQLLAVSTLVGGSYGSMATLVTDDGRVLTFSTATVRACRPARYGVEELPTTS